MEYSQLQVYCVKILVYCRFPWLMHSNIFSPLPTIHMNYYVKYGGVKMVAVHGCELWYIHMH